MQEHPGEKEPEQVKALLSATRNGDVGSVHRLLMAGVSTSVCSMGEGLTPLYVAAQENREEVVSTLLTARADVNFAADNLARPLHAAAYSGCANVARMLIAARADVNAYMDQGVTPLHAAARCGHAGVVQILLDSRAGIDLRKSNGSTALHVASRRGHLEVASVLLAARANVDAQQGVGATPLYVAAQEGQLEVATQLVAAGASVDVAQETGATPLFIAAKEGHIGLVVLLLTARADPNARKENGMTALHAAARRGDMPLAIALLEAKGAVEAQQCSGVRPLHVAARCGHLATVQTLCSYGGRRDVSSHPAAQRITTPEGIARRHGHHAVADWLQATVDWVTPLHHVKLVSHQRALRLLQEGADPFAVSPAELERVRILGDKSSHCSAPITPYLLATQAALEGEAPPDCAVSIVLAAAQPWSPANHHCFPPRARARAVTLLMIGWLLSRSQRFDNAATAFLDVWIAHVMPHAISRSDD